MGTGRMVDNWNKAFLKYYYLEACPNLTKQMQHFVVVIEKAIYISEQGWIIGYICFYHLILTLT